MNRTETIFFIAATILLLICVSTMLEYSFIFIFMLALAAIVIIMSLFSKYSAKHENGKLSRMTKEEFRSKVSKEFMDNNRKIIEQLKNNNVINFKKYII